MKGDKNKHNSSNKSTNPPDGRNGINTSIDGGVGLQLEQLANTNVLILRIKWLGNAEIDLINNKINLLNNVFNDFNGLLINSMYIESYQYLKDDKRLKYIKENNYFFENASQEYENSYSNTEHNDQENNVNNNIKNNNNNNTNANDNDWKYDIIFQCQFKKKIHLKSCLSKILSVIKTDNYDNENDDKSILQYWSISLNYHALSHPGNLFIGNISSSLSLSDLNKICEPFGPILSLKLINNSNNNNNNNNNTANFGFVSYQLGSQASNCINSINGEDFDGKNLLVNYHVERKERERLYWDQFKYSNTNNNNKNNNTNSFDTQNMSKYNVNGNLSDTGNSNNGYSNMSYNKNMDKEDDFKCVFIGNLPKIYFDEIRQTTNDNDVSDNSDVTGKTSSENHKEPKNTDENLVLAMVASKLTKKFPDFKILSSYFPKDTTSNNSGEVILKGYGFIKVNTHEQALAIIETLDSFEWLGNKLIVNKAIQNRVHRNPNNTVNSNNAVNNFNEFKGYDYNQNISRSSSILEILPLSSIGQQQQFSPHYFPTSNSSPLSASPPSLNNSTIHSINEYTLAASNERPNVSDKNRTNSNSNNLQSPTFFHQSIIPQFIPAPYASNLPIPLNNQQESNLYIKHLPLYWKDQHLYQYYKKFGKIVSAKIITIGGSSNENVNHDNINKGTNSCDDDDNDDMIDNENKVSISLPVGTSKGYGFVCFENPVNASRAILMTNGMRIDSNNILEVSFAKKNGSNNTSNSDNTINKRYSIMENREASYNQKFINALIQEQNQFMMMNSPPQSQAVMGPISPAVSSMTPNATAYTYMGSQPPNHIPTFVPMSSYGMIPFRNPSQPNILN